MKKSELRKYMEQEFGGLRETRSDGSYALEFLQTNKENLRKAQARSNLTLAVETLAYHLKWCQEQTEKIPQLIEAIKKLESK